MAYNFRPAVRENVNLMIGLAGGTGSGKTYTALRLATGIAQAMLEAGLTKVDRFAVIDTENGRARHYADRFKFDVADLTAPFAPAKYTEAILAADAAGYPVIVVDSMSHEYAGEGGVLDMQEAEFQRLGAREAVKLLSWAAPKGEHKHMVTRLLQVRAHLILCFRAEPKIEVGKDEKGKTVIVPKKSLVGLDGWIPVTEKNLPFELTVSLLFTADAPGIPKPIKLQEQHRALFPLDRAVTEDSGKAVAAWAKGGTPKEASPASLPKEEALRAPVTSNVITLDQAVAMRDLIALHQVTAQDVCEKGHIDALEDMAADRYDSAMNWIRKQPKKEAA